MKPLSRLFSSWELLRAERRVETLIRQQAPTFCVMEAVELAARLSEQLRPEDSPLSFAWLQLLGNYYRETGNPKAELCLKRALRIARRIFPPLDPRLSLALNNLAWICRLLGRFEEAESYYREALSIDTLAFGTSHPETLASMNNLGILLNQRNDPARNDQAEARTLLQHICETDRKLYPPIHPIIAEDRISWACSVLINEGDWSGAEREIREALQIYETICPQMTLKIAAILITLANVLSAQGEGFQTEALKLYQRALLIDETEFGPNHPDVGTDLCNIAITQARGGSSKDAFGQMNRACQIDNHVIAQVFSISSETQRLTYALAFQQRFDALISLISQYLSNSRVAKFEGLGLVLRRKAVVAESVAAERDVVMTGKYPELKIKLQVLATLRMEVAQMTLGGSPVKGSVSYRRQLKELTSRKERIEAELTQQVSELGREQRLRSIDRQVVAMALPVGSILVEFVRFNVFDFDAVVARGESQWKSARYQAFVMHAGEPDDIAMVDLGEAEPIDRMITTFRKNILGEAEDGERGLGAAPKSIWRVRGEDVGVQLREAVFTPLLNAIGDGKRLMISPDGDLTRLPFEVLPMDDGRRLIDDYRISYLSAGRDVVRFQFKSDRKPSRSLVAADPDFDLGAKPVHAEAANGGRRSRDFKPGSIETFRRLPGTGIEGKTIAAMLDAELWTEGAVLDARLKQCQSPRILHLATHGFFLEDQKHDPNEDRFACGSMSFSESGMERLTGARLENPLLRSGLALAGANTWLEKGELLEEAEDGLLTAVDVSGLDLSDTELVTLSACDTGLGEVHVGEGVFGLQRAFMLAGAKTLVMSLWEVPDEQTRELMEDFYRRILGLDGNPPQPRADALREAQLAMKAKHAEPLYWGAFICQGDPRSLPS